MDGFGSRSSQLRSDGQKVIVTTEGRGRITHSPDQRFYRIRFSGLKTIPTSGYILRWFGRAACPPNRGFFSLFVLLMPGLEAAKVLPNSSLWPEHSTGHSYKNVFVPRFTNPPNPARRAVRLEDFLDRHAGGAAVSRLRGRDAKIYRTRLLLPKLVGGRRVAAQQR